MLIHRTGFWGFLDARVVHTPLRRLLPNRTARYICDRWDAGLLGMSVVEMRRYDLEQLALAEEGLAASNEAFDLTEKEMLR